MSNYQNPKSDSSKNDENNVTGAIIKVGSFLLSGGVAIATGVVSAVSEVINSATDL